MVEDRDNPGGQAWRENVSLPDRAERSDPDTVRNHRRGFVYAIVNQATWTVYIGVTRGTAYHRASTHRAHLRDGRHAEALQADWAADEDHAMCFEVLEELPKEISDVQRFMRESAWISALMNAGVTLYNTWRYDPTVQGLVRLPGRVHYRARRATSAEQGKP